jgi:hypothetical protein
MSKKVILIGAAVVGATLVGKTKYQLIRRPL